MSELVDSDPDLLRKVASGKTIDHDDFSKLIGRLERHAIERAIQLDRSLGDSIDDAIAEQVEREKHGLSEAIKSFEKAEEEASEEGRATAVTYNAISATINQHLHEFAARIAKKLPKGKVKNRDAAKAYGLLGGHANTVAVAKLTIQTAMRELLSSRDYCVCTALDREVGRVVEQDLIERRTLNTEGKMRRKYDKKQQGGTDGQEQKKMPSLRSRLAGKKVWEKRNILWDFLKAIDEEPTLWSAEEQARVGGWLILNLHQVQATPLFEQHTHYDPDRKGIYKSVEVYSLTEAGRDVLAESHEFAKACLWDRSPSYIPMRGYTGAMDGGYWSACGTRTARLVPGRFRPEHRAYIQEHLEEIQRVLLAVFCAQSLTSWRVNTRVLNRWLIAVDNGEAIGEMPETTPALVPNVGEDATPRSKRERDRILELNKEREHNRAYVQGVRRTVEDFAKRPFFYLPYTLDFRGRSCCLCPHLNPQGPGWIRALLEFGEGVPIVGEAGKRWLQIHTANMFGQDKLSYKQRIEWVQKSESLLRRVAKGSSLAWKKRGGDSWLALAACLDYVAYLEEGDGYVSHLPVTVDGSCNALQHIAALARDEKAASLVNLAKGCEPSDFYAVIAQQDQFHHTDIASFAEEMSQAGEGKSLRPLVKEVVMPYFYGRDEDSMEYAARRAIRGQARSAGLELEFERAKTIATHVVEGCQCAIKHHAPSAYDVREWLEGVADACNQLDQPVQWVSPSGWPVVQDYALPSSKTSRIYVGDEERQRTVRVDSPDRDKEKQKRALAPNFVHSLDAAHLTNVIVSAAFAAPCVSSPISHIMHVHDSIGTHAANMERLQGIIREEFGKMYRDADPMQGLIDGLRERGIASASNPPSQGSFDVSQTRDAEYLFS